MSDPSVSPLPFEYRAPWWAYVLCGMASITLIYATFRAGYLGLWWLAGPLALASSYLTILLTRYVIDGRPLSQIFSFRVQSWALLFDVFLAAAVAASSYGWRHLDPSGWHTQAWWMVLSVICGYTIGFAWHYLLDRPNYIREGAEALLYDPAKLGHDLITYPVLGSALIFLAVPVLATRLWTTNPLPYLIVLCLAVWVFGGVHDAGKRADGAPRLNVYDLHDAFNWRQLRPEPAFADARS